MFSTSNFFPPSKQLYREYLLFPVHRSPNFFLHFEISSRKCLLHRMNQAPENKVHVGGLVVGIELSPIVDLNMSICVLSTVPAIY